MGVDLINELLRKSGGGGGGGNGLFKEGYLNLLKNWTKKLFFLNFMQAVKKKLEYHLVKSGPSPKTCLCSAGKILNIHVHCT